MRASFDSFGDFFPHYLREHASPVNRGLHYVGTSLAIGLLAAAIQARSPWLLLGVPVAGYGFAWVGHFLVEKNRPATFRHPIWSLIGDLAMFSLFLVGRLGPYLRDAGVEELAPEADHR